MKFHSILTVLLASAAIATPAIAQQADASDPTPDRTAQGDVAVTIYQDGNALVQDVRRLDIPSGRTRIEFPDVSAQIRPATLSFEAPGTAIVEQNFDFDLLTPTKLMEKAIGSTVTLVRTNPATGQEVRERAEVLSTAGGVVVRIGNRIEVLRDDGLPVRVVFDQVPPNLRARPTLSVTLDSNRVGARDASIRYLTPGLGWEADYVALFDEASGTVDMQGWVTLTNNTGTTFHNADTLLVAGNPSRAGQRTRSDMVRPGTQTADRERLGDYYLYPLDERTTIANAQTKQVSFLDVSRVPAQRVYSIGTSWLRSDDDFRPAATAIGFSSSRDGGLGDALPAGTVRFYQRDAAGNPQYIGENRIGHTPMGSTLSLVTGDAFDVFVKAEVESREEISADEYERTARYRVIEDGEVVREVEVDEEVEYFRTTMRYTFTNAKSEPVTVQMIQYGLDQYWWARDFRVVSEDVEGEQLNADRRLYSVRVPANGERVVRVTYETKF
ncbi:MAG: DUF4139 domain-containing protein [Sphingomonadales bacterium CG12_big_fil_rev_8_21_14_0_65_65_10]|uniref:DUF4139 domain-containing protein n=1 Tax=Blastomonas marina TaxID=1867408 RepID=UPI000CC7F3DA|nr:DUF4139 domain-containing protein [Blastomonas marina]PIW54013.1 MAG: DUF4139 domain-containing protein [Sphingomonadales bacterium CG12_big_fil_rev_8_21_14_0_65_65_10]WPZ04471.1 DUF4139 domain-containing protein [Blastomonas marina]